MAVDKTGCWKFDLLRELQCLKVSPVAQFAIVCNYIPSTSFYFIMTEFRARVEYFRLRLK